MKWLDVFAENSARSLARRTSRRSVIAGLGWRSEVSEQRPWPADEKVVAEELGPYLASLDAATDPPRWR